MSYIVQLAAIEHVEWSIRTATVVTFGEGVEPLDLGRLPLGRIGGESPSARASSA